MGSGRRLGSGLGRGRGRIGGQKDGADGVNLGLDSSALGGVEFAGSIVEGVSAQVNHGLVG